MNRYLQALLIFDVAVPAFLIGLPCCALFWAVLTFQNFVVEKTAERDEYDNQGRQVAALNTELAPIRAKTLVLKSLLSYGRCRDQAGSRHRAGLEKLSSDEVEQTLHDYQIGPSVIGQNFGEGRSFVAQAFFPLGVIEHRHSRLGNTFSNHDLGVSVDRPGGRVGSFRALPSVHAHVLRRDRELILNSNLETTDFTDSTDWKRKMPVLLSTFKPRAAFRSALKCGSPVGTLSRGISILLMSLPAGVCGTCACLATTGLQCLGAKPFFECPAPRRMGHAGGDARESFIVAQARGRPFRNRHPRPIQKGLPPVVEHPSEQPNAGRYRRQRTDGRKSRPSITDRRGECGPARNPDRVASSMKETCWCWNPAAADSWFGSRAWRSAVSPSARWICKSIFLNRWGLRRKVYLLPPHQKNYRGNPAYGIPDIRHFLNKDAQP